MKKNIINDFSFTFQIKISKRFSLANKTKICQYTIQITFLYILLEIVFTIATPALDILFIFSFFFNNFLFVYIQNNIQKKSYIITYIKISKTSLTKDKQ